MKKFSRQLRWSIAAHAFITAAMGIHAIQMFMSGSSTTGVWLLIGCGFVAVNVGNIMLRDELQGLIDYQREAIENLLKGRS